MNQPNLISVLSSSSGCLGFLRPGPRGIMAYDSSGASLGLFETKAAAVEAITTITSTGE